MSEFIFEETPKPSGECVLTILEVGVSNTQNGRARAIWRFVIESPEQFRGMTITSSQLLDSNVGRGIFRRQLASLGYELEPGRPYTVEELNEILKQYLGVQVVGVVRQRDRFTDVAIRRVV